MHGARGGGRGEKIHRREPFSPPTSPHGGDACDERGGAEKENRSPEGRRHKRRLAPRPPVAPPCGAA